MRKRLCLPVGKEIRLRDRAVATNRLHHYDLCYREGCRGSHGGFETLQYIVPGGISASPIEILVGPYNPDARAVELALPSMLQRPGSSAGNQT